MPQVTGAVTWETNVKKRQTTQKKPVVVDNSLTRIENHHIEARMRIRVGRLQEEEQRVVTDRNLEIRNVERDLAEFARLKTALKENHVDPVMEKWRRQRLARAASAAPRVTTTRADHGADKFQSNHNFSHAFVNDDDDMPFLQSVRTRHHRSRSAEPTHQRWKSPSPGPVMPRPATPLLRTPSVDRLPERKQRPKTTTGRPSERLGTTNVRTRPTSSVQVSQATRSFQELRDLTRLGHMTKGRALTAAGWQQRTDAMQNDETGLQQRMARFLKDIDDFKKRDTKEYQAMLNLSKYK